MTDPQILVLTSGVLVGVFIGYVSMSLRFIWKMEGKGYKTWSEVPEAPEEKT